MLKFVYHTMLMEICLTAKLRNMFGYEPMTNLESGLSSYILTTRSPTSVVE